MLHDDVREAVRRLAEAVASHPESIPELAAYGDLPDHLTDLIEDLESEG